jgi:hypothetical protein
MESQCILKNLQYSLLHLLKKTLMTCVSFAKQARTMTCQGRVVNSTANHVQRAHGHLVLHSKMHPSAKVAMLGRTATLWVNLRTLASCALLERTAAIQEALCALLVPTEHIPPALGVHRAQQQIQEKRQCPILIFLFGDPSHRRPALLERTAWVRRTRALDAKPESSRLQRVQHRPPHARLALLDPTLQILDPLHAPGVALENTAPRLDRVQTRRVCLVKPARTPLGMSRASALHVALEDGAILGVSNFSRSAIRVPRGHTPHRKFSQTVCSVHRAMVVHIHHSRVRRTAALAQNVPREHIHPRQSSLQQTNAPSVVWEHTLQELVRHQPILVPSALQEHTRRHWALLEKIPARSVALDRGRMWREALIVRSAPLEHTLHRRASPATERAPYALQVKTDNGYAFKR